MCNCGNPSGEIRLAPTIYIPSYVPTPAHSARRAMSDREVPVRHAREGVVAVRGGVTGRVYQFSGEGCTCVAEEDAKVLVASGRYLWG